MPTKRTDIAETRLSPAFEFKLDARPSIDTGAISGYAAVFGSMPDAFGDVISPGAFTRTLANRAWPPAMLWSHDPARVVGKWTNMGVDGMGLRVEGQVNLKTSEGRDVFEHLRAGDVTGLSIGFLVPPGGRVRNADGSFTLVDLDLLEISVVAVPANRDARVTSVKNVHLSSKSELVELLHKSGLARAAASKVASGGWSALSGKTDGETDECFCCARTTEEVSIKWQTKTGRPVCETCAHEFARKYETNPETLNSIAAALRASAARWRA